MKHNKNVPTILEGHTDTSLIDTVFHHFESGAQFMKSIQSWSGVFKDGMVQNYIDEGTNKFNSSKVNASYSTLYKDVADKVKAKLHTRGFTTKLLYSTPEFTSTNTGCMSKQRAMLGRRDCYFTSTGFSDAKLFHDIYVNLSYDADISDETIRNNAYALFALSKELGRIVPIRIYVVNHVKLNQNYCYSYTLKKFRQPIKPEEFMFFTSDSKRTFGFAAYDIQNNGYRNYPTVGSPQNTVSIADFSLDTEINSIVESLLDRYPRTFKGVIK